MPPHELRLCYERLLIGSFLLALACSPADEEKGTRADHPSGHLLGLRTVIYHVSDLARAKEWYSRAFGVQPYFDQPFYVGFNIGGYELGLDPDTSATRPGSGGAVAYWGVDSIETALEHLKTLNAEVKTPITEVGGGVRVATLSDPFGNVIGIIENPNFVLPSR